MTISIALPSRNRPMELSCTLGALFRIPQVGEIVVLDNSDLPYLDNPLFVILQDMFSREGKSLSFVREVGRYHVAELKYRAMCRCSGRYAMAWDDDSIPMTSFEGLEDRLNGYGLLGMSFLDVVNYLGYTDWVDWTDPDDLKEIIHPTAVVYRWFREGRYDRIETPWGADGIFLTERRPWLDFYETQGSLELIKESCNFVPPELVINTAYVSSLGKTSVTYFCDRVTNLYHPTQERDWDISSFERTMRYLDKKYVKGRKACFVGDEFSREI